MSDVRGHFASEEQALIELLNTQNVQQTLIHKNRRRAEPHIECEQGPPDSDTNDSECHHARVKLLADLMSEHGRSMKLYTDVHTKGKDLRSQSNQATTDVDVLSQAVSEPTQGLAASARALITGASDLRQGLIITADRLWSDLLTVNNLTNQDVDAVKTASLTGIGSLLNSSQAILNEEARVHHALMSRIVGRTNAKMSDLANDLNTYQARLDEALTLYGVEGAKKTEHLEKLAEKFTQQFEALHGLSAETPEKAKELLNHFESMLADELKKEEEKSKVDVQQKVEGLKSSIASKLDMFQIASEKAMQESSVDIENLLSYNKERITAGAQAVASVSSLTRDEIKQLAEFSAEQATKSALTERERLEKLFFDVASIGKSAGKAGEAARKLASDLSGLVSEGMGAFGAELSSSDSAIRRNLQALVTGASGATADQLVSLINSLGLMADTIGETNDASRKDVREIMEKLEDSLSRKIRGQAALAADQQNALGSLSATLNAELDSSSGVAERSLRGDGSALLQAALNQAASLEAVARDADAQEAQLKKDMAAAVTSGDLQLQATLAAKGEEIARRKRETEAQIREIALQLNAQGAVASSAAKSLREALQAAGASEVEIRKALDETAKGGSIAELANRLAGGDERILRRLGQLLGEAKREADAVMQQDLGEVRERLVAMLGTARMHVAEVEVKADGEARKESAYTSLVDKKRRDLEAEVLGLTGNSADGVVVDLFRKQSKMREFSEKQFMAELLEARGNAEEKLGLMSEEVASKQTKIKDDIKFAFLGQLQELSKGLGGQEALAEINELLKAMRELEFRLHDVKNATDGGFVEFTRTFVSAFSSIGKLEEKLAGDTKQIGSKVDSLLPDLNAKNQTVLARLRETTEAFAARMGSLAADLDWRKSYMIRSIYGGRGKEDQDARGLAELVTSGASAGEKKLATKRLKAIADMQGLIREVKKEDTSIFVKVGNASDAILREDEALINSDLRPLIERIKASEGALKADVTTATESIGNILLSASDTASSMNETVQTALLSLKTQAEAANQNTQFSMNVASIQAGKMIDFASKLEAEGAEAQQALHNYWETAADKAENDAKTVRRTIDDSRRENDERLARVFSELGKMDGEGAAEIEAQGRDLEMQVAILRRLVNGLVTVWSEFAEAAVDKHKFFEAKNKEFLLALEGKVDGEKERLNSVVKRGLYELSSGVAMVDQAWVAENQFQFEVARGQDEVKLAANALKTIGVGKVTKLGNDVRKFDQDEETEHKAFEAAVTKALAAFEQRVTKKVNEVLNLQ